MNAAVRFAALTLYCLTVGAIAAAAAALLASWFLPVALIVANVIGIGGGLLMDRVRHAVQSGKDHQRT